VGRFSFSAHQVTVERLQDVGRFDERAISINDTVTVGVAVGGQAEGYPAVALDPRDEIVEVGW